MTSQNRLPGGRPTSVRSRSPGCPSPPADRASQGSRFPFRGLIGFGLVGYGLLVLLGLAVHESAVLAAFSILLGVLLLWRRVPRVALQRRGLVFIVGMVAAGGTVAYNALRGSGLGWAEWSILAYGSVLVAASFRLSRPIGRTDVGTLVAWSFPLVLAPLAIYAVNAAFSSNEAATSATPFVYTLVVLPTSVLMGLLGTPVHLIGTNMILATPRGSLSLGVGLVCAGLYPMVLFAAMLGLHAWRESMPRLTFALHLTVGLVILWLLNVVRLVILAHVGIRWGPATLQTVHAHLGWILFVLFMLGYWTTVAVRRRRPARDA